MKELASSEVLIQIMALFFENAWNSCLHRLFESIAGNVLTSCYPPLLETLLEKDELPRRLVDAAESPSHTTPKGCEIRRGNMATVIKISNALVTAGETTDAIK
ncbi:MAG: hypothetical protein V2I33_19665 [Kangiellaceae bacterium]|jgi:hypothetical protein|nr:hypothetical protein [Kangiellaceae bacterium]